MSYIVPVHNATSIRHVLHMKFCSPDRYDLVFAKGNRIEVWQLEDGGLKRKHTKIIYGTIVMLQRLRPTGSDTDLLFVGTERQQYLTLAWNSDVNELECIMNISDDAEPLMRHSQSQNKCLVDPTGKFLVLHLWEGVLTVFRLPARGQGKDRLKMKTLEALASIRNTELWMKASTFLHSRNDHPRIAFLYQTQQDREEARIAVYRLTKDDANRDLSSFDPKKDRELDEKILDPYASMLIPVPVPEEEKSYRTRKGNAEGIKARLGGLIVVGETLLTYFDSLTYAKVSTPLNESKLYVAWVEIDPTHYLLADDYGFMDLLTIETKAEHSLKEVFVTGMQTETMQFKADPLMGTSRVSQMLYLGDDYLFVASHSGDPQLLRIDTASRQMEFITGGFNNAPILDFAIMDLGNREGEEQFGSAYSTGQARLVAGCGAYKDGTLRSIRSGVGLEEHGILLEVDGTRGLFSIWSHGARMVDTLVVSLINETRVFKFDPEGGVEEVFECQGMDLAAETLLARSLPSGRLLYIMPKAVLLIDSESGMEVTKWDVPQNTTITAVSANDKWALLAIDGSTLVRLDLDNDLKEQSRDTQQKGAAGFGGDQISCLCAAQNPEGLGVIGWWASGSVSVIDLATLEPLHGENVRETEDSASVPRDIALVQLHPPSISGPTLLIATEDGSVVSYNIFTADGFKASGRKSVMLGSSPARFHLLPHSNGECSVFATTEIASLIHSNDGRIMYSASSADDATFVTPFSSEAFPGHIIISTNEHVRLSAADTERLTHVKSLSIKESVRRVAYSPDLKAFALGCIKKELVVDTEVITSTVKLVDEIAFHELGNSFVLNAASGIELVECLIQAQLPDSKGNLAERFIVGTSYIPNDPNIKPADLTCGRIVVLGVDDQRQLYQIMSRPLRGACRCLGILNGLIVAGLQKTVVVYDYVEETSVTGSLRVLASYRTANTPIDLAVSGNIIGVGDLTQSLALVEFTPSVSGADAKLEEVARHYEPAWSTAVCSLGGEKWLETDARGNVIVLRRNLEAPTDQDKMRMEVVSEMNIGEQINKIKRLYISPNENAIVSPKAFLASTEGAVYLFGEVLPEYQDLLINFQTRVSQHLTTPGNLPFDKWRAYRTEAREEEGGPYRFLDGDILERFLDMNEAKQESVCQGLGTSVERMRNIVEELKRMH